MAGVTNWMETALVTEVVAPTASRPTFASPILRSTPGSNASYVQQIDLAGKVAAFDQCEPAESPHRVLQPDVRVSLRQEALHAILDPDGQIVVGVRQVVAAAIRPWLSRIQHPLTRLAFAEFAGERGAAAAAAREAFDALARQDGSEAARHWYLDAVLGARVIRTLMSSGQGATDIRAFERLVERTRVAIDDRTLIVAVDPELKAERPAALEASRFDAVLDLARLIGARSLKVALRPTPQQVLERSRGAAKAAVEGCAVLVIGDTNLFNHIAARTPIDRRILRRDWPSDSARAGSHMVFERDDQVRVDFIRSAGQIKSTLGDLTDWGRDRGSQCQILILCPRDQKSLRELRGELSTFHKQYPRSRGGPVLTVGLLTRTIDAEGRANDVELATAGLCDAVLSLANAWTPTVKGKPGSASRLSHCIEGWICAALSGAVEAASPINVPARILSCARLDGRSPALFARVLAAASNPQWADVGEATLVVGTPGDHLNKLSPLRVGSPLGQAHSLGRYGAVLGRADLVLDPVNRLSDSAFAMAQFSVDTRQREEALVDYLADILSDEGWEIIRNTHIPVGDLHVRRAELPDVVIDVKRRLADVSRKPVFMESDRWRCIVTMDTLSNAQRVTPRVISFDQLSALPTIVREDLEGGMRGSLLDADLGTVPGMEGAGFTGARIAPEGVASPEIARIWLRDYPNFAGRLLLPMISGRDLARFPEGRWVINRSEMTASEAPEIYRYSVERRYEADARDKATPHLPQRIVELAQRQSFIVTPTLSKHRIFIRCRGAVAPTSSVIVIRDDPAWLLGLLSSSAHRIWSEAVGSVRGGVSRYTVRALETFPLPLGLAQGTLQDDGLAAERSRLGDDLTRTRTNWQFEGLHWPVDFGFDAVTALTMHTPDEERLGAAVGRALTKLYDRPPAWFSAVQDRLDAVVLEAYGLKRDATAREVIDRLVDLNSEQSGSQVRKLF